MSTVKHSVADVVVSGAEAHYFGRLADGFFEIPRCLDCDRHHFYPRVICPHCGSDRLQWASPAGTGTVYSTTVVRHKDGDYNVCLIELDEGPRMMSRVSGVDPAGVRIGMRVRAAIEQAERAPLVVFHALEPRQ
ncbi:OB-fold domain-containing protein [Cupriavidus necator]|uniref:Zn-ribbon domain-containing OB-fold protein n=1 Tax=Cupriavidus necator TaxID=106590 RepID=UPI0039C2BC6B